MFSEYCDLTYHYLSLDIINTDTTGSYNYTFSNLTAGMSNSGITYTQTSSSTFLFKIPLNKIPSGANPAVFIYSVAATGNCSLAPYTLNGQAIVLSPCTLVGPGYTVQNSLSSVTTISYYTIYPNPSASVLNISLSDNNMIPANSLNSQAILFDINGIESTRKTIMNNTATLDVSQLKKGIYILKIIDNTGNTESHQVVIN